ncbi:prophage MuMc02 [uncultured Mediterranean phage uvMED]|nr:prophage MuMc02 [uncultured Mediterranean phage uvMED]
MAGIKDYSTTAGNNTSIGGVSVAEGMLPSNINNAFRAITADIREFYNDAQYVIYGDGDAAFTIAYASATSFTVAGVDVTTFYHAGRRIKAVGSSTGTIFGTISSSNFSTNTTVNVTFDSGSLQNESLTIFVGILSKTGDSIPEDVIDGTKIADDSINSEHYVDGSIDTAHIADLQVSTAKIAADAITGAKIADDAINSEHYTDGSIDTAHIADANVTLAKLASDSVNSSKIVDGSIVNADINASAAIDATKIHDGTISNTEFGYLNGVSSGIQTQLDAKQASDAELTAIAGLTSAADKGIQFTGSGSAATYDLTTAGKALLDDADAAAQRSTLGLGTIATQAANSVSISGGSITGLGDPSSSADAANKNYVDQLIAGLRTRIVAEVATTANVDLSADLQNGDTIDGVTLATGDRVLVKDQSTGSQNGLYTVVASGTASRDTEYDTIAELSGQMVVVNQGSTNDNKIFLCTTNNTASLGSDTITFTQVTPSNTGTVTSVGVADAGAGEFTVGSTPVTSSGTITLAINSIADSKLATISTANKVSAAALDIDGASDIGADLTTSDLIIVDDGAGGTNRKATLTRLITFVKANTDDPTALAIALG